MLQTLGGFMSSKNMLVDEQVDMLFKKAKPIKANSTDPRWKWFKNYLGALYGTHIKIRVPKVDKPRYRMQKCDIATNMLGFVHLICNLFMFFLV
ncbi:hypothetical protein Gotur_029285, partial [Gossypium turneri]